MRDTFSWRKFSPGKGVNQWENLFSFVHAYLCTPTAPHQPYTLGLSTTVSMIFSSSFAILLPGHPPPHLYSLKMFTYLPSPLSSLLQSYFHPGWPYHDSVIHSTSIFQWPLCAQALRQVLRIQRWTLRIQQLALMELNASCGDRPKSYNYPN